MKKEYECFVPADYKSAIDCAVQIAKKYNINMYLIGGVVRDLILKNEFKDVDITIEGDAVEFGEILAQESDVEIIASQENLRTIKVKFKNSVEIDFASTREEKYADSGVLPVAYNFGCSLEKDVKRRDFTINTLAMSLCGENEYRIIDYFGGFEDISNKIIRILHNKSFIDDPSRMVRALKFLVRFNFCLDEKTEILMIESLNSAEKLYPYERIKNELFQYFTIDRNDLYQKLVDYKIYKLFTDNPIINLDENEIDKTQKAFILFLVLILNSDFENEKYNISSKEKKILYEVKELRNNTINSNNNYAIYKKYNGKSDLAIDIYYLISKDETVIKYIEKLRYKEVKISGDDLIKLGYKPSKYFSEIFDIILREKLKGELNTKEEEINFVKESIKKTE